MNLRTMHLTRSVISLLPLFAANCGSPASTLYAQAAGWNGGWARMEDPVEHAFTLDVPQGWTARGGLFRLGLSDYRPMVDLKSPDGRTNIRLGDVSSLHIPYPIDFTRERETSWIWARRRR